MKAKVSIVVPVYNGEDSIEECLGNLTKQTLKEIEIICVNDGSTDGSLEVINKMIEKDARIRVVSRENGGLSCARNTGLENVKTPYVMFCDADDYFAPEMCKTMVQAIEENEVDLVACGTEVEYKAHSEIEESDNNYYRIKFSGKNYINEEIIAKTDVSVCDKIFRVDLIKKYKIEFPEGLNNEDYYFYNAYMSVVNTIFFVNKKLYRYIRHEDSIMSDNFNKNAYSPDHLLIAIKLFDFYKKNGFLKRHLNLFWNQFDESYWFSYEHSAKKYHGKLQKKAKDFISENYQNNLPTNQKTRRKINAILHNTLSNKVVRKAKSGALGVYRKVNYGYRQQDYINRQIESMIEKTEELSDKVKNEG